MKNISKINFAILILFISSAPLAKLLAEIPPYSSYEVDFPEMQNTLSPAAVLGESAQIIIGGSELKVWDFGTLEALPGSSIPGKTLKPLFYINYEQIVGLAYEGNIAKDIFIYSANSLSVINTSAKFSEVSHITVNSEMQIVGYGTTLSGKLKGFLINDSQVEIKNNLYDLVTDKGTFYVRRDVSTGPNTKEFEAYRIKNLISKKIRTKNLANVAKGSKIIATRVIAERPDDSIILEVKAKLTNNDKAYTLQHLIPGKKAKILVKESRKTLLGKNFHSNIFKENYFSDENNFIYNLGAYYLNNNKEIIPAEGFLHNFESQESKSLLNLTEFNSTGCPVKFLTANSNGIILAYQVANSDLFCEEPTSVTESPTYNIYLLFVDTCGSGDVRRVC